MQTKLRLLGISAAALLAMSGQAFAGSDMSNDENQQQMENPKTMQQSEKDAVQQGGGGAPKSDYEATGVVTQGEGGPPMDDDESEASGVVTEGGTSLPRGSEASNY